METALAIVDREGLDALTMRRLGSELGVEAMSLYNHVANKAALMDGLLELVSLKIPIPEEPATWREAVQDMARTYRRVVLQHPNVMPLIMSRPFNTLASLRPVEFGFKIMLEAGFSPAFALTAFRTLLSFASGYVVSEIAGFFGEPDGSSNLAVEDLEPDEFPALAKVLQQVVGTDHEKEFELALDVIMRGLEETAANHR
jgi:AcrR family transcriptional regulator